MGRKETEREMNKETREKRVKRDGEVDKRRRGNVKWSRQRGEETWETCGRERVGMIEEGRGRRRGGEVRGWSERQIETEADREERKQTSQHIETDSTIQYS